MRPSINRGLIADGLRQLGVGGAGLMLVHSSLSSFGNVEGGAQAVVDALLDVAGEEGSVFVPTFNYGQLAYDVATTPSLTGAISECLRRLPGAKRSAHPTHPIAGVGPMAEEIVREHPLMRPFGEGSPLWRLWEADARVVLLGCDHRASSMIHVGEIAAKVPYPARTRIGRVIEGGRERELVVTRPPCSKGFNIVDEPLRRAGRIREGHIGEARVMVMRARDVVDAVVGLLARDPTALLCHEADCVICTESRRVIGERRGATEPG